MLAPVTEHAPAKVNLALHITGKREDGYHLLDSLVAFTTFGDTLECYPDDIISMDVQGTFAHALNPDPNNSILKAARLLQEQTGCRQGARMTLHKYIPVSAGLGGGSSNAAAALRALCHLWNASVPQEKLEAIALGIGSDVPVCLRARPAVMRGIGEQVTPVEIAEAGIVLINPGVPLATADVFKNRVGEVSPHVHWSRMDSYDALMHALQQTGNHLEAAAVKLCPPITQGLHALQQSPGCDLARMSGSGATCFGLFKNEALAEHAAAYLQHALPGWWIKPTTLRPKNTPAI